MKTISLSFAIIFLLLISCDQGTLPGSSLGRFDYSAYDSVGVPVARGWLQISGEDSTAISGTWHIEAVGTPSNIGPQLGDGALVGYVDHNRLFVELNPQYRDNNVGLFGAFDGARFEGSWTYSGFPGIINSGSFTAVRRSE